jgi:hypothetical protein
VCCKVLAYESGAAENHDIDSHITTNATCRRS